VDEVDGKTVKGRNVLPVTLDSPTQKLIELIFSQDMFKEAMECMDLGRCVCPLEHNTVARVVIGVVPGPFFSAVLQAC